MEINDPHTFRVGKVYRDSEKKIKFKFIKRDGPLYYFMPTEPQIKYQTSAHFVGLIPFYFVEMDFPTGSWFYYTKDNFKFGK